MTAPFAFRTLVLGCLACAFPVAHAIEGEEQPQAVQFVFGWKPGLKISVDHKTSQEMPDKARRSAVRYTLAVDAAGEHLAVKFLNPRIGGPTLTANAGIPAFQGQLSAAAFPELIVKQSGEYAGLADPAGQSTRVLTLLQKMVEERVSGPARIGINNGLVMFASPAFLHSKASELWNPIVGFWAGAELRVGEVIAFEEMTPFPLIPGAQLKQKGEVTLVETHTCLRGGAERTCAGILMRTDTDPDDVARLLKEVLEHLNKSGKPVPKFDGLSFTSQLTLVTEPDGLFPHEYSLSREMQLTTTTNGKTEKARRTDTQDVRYTY